MSIDGAVSEIVQSGVLGALLILSIVAIVYLYKDNKSIQKDRISDLKEVRNLLIEPLDNIKTTVSRTLSLVEKLIDGGK